MAALCLLLFVACDVREMSTLPELSRPYAGVYRCKELTLGGQDCLDEFEELTIELKYGGAFLLTCRREGGKEEKKEGKYEVSEGNITLALPFAGRYVSRTFPFEKGEIAITHSYGGKMLFARFVR